MRDRRRRGHLNSPLARNDLSFHGLEMMVNMADVYLSLIYDNGNANEELDK
jgi:inactivated superfamily I helicase